MTNDAKLGLLAGVVGVIVAAVVSVPRPAPAPAADAAAAPAAPPKVLAKADPDDAAPRTLPTDLPSSPVARTKKEPDATPTSRPRNDDDIDP